MRTPQPSNLIEGKSITGPNQVWQTDITYVWSDRRWYYISFVIDVHTRQILVGHCSRNLSTVSQVHCLAKDRAGQKGKELTRLIIHTDRGVLYTSSEYKAYLSRRGFTPSMAHYAWQNAYYERVNRTIKTNYLVHYNTNGYRSLCVGLARAVRVYNRSKPHRGLPSRLSPDQFANKRNQGSYLDDRVNIWSKLTSTNMVYDN